MTTANENTDAAAGRPHTAGLPTGSAGPQTGSHPAPFGAPVGPPPAIDYVTGALTMPGFSVAYAQTVMSGKHDKLALWYADVHNFRSLNPKYGFSAGNDALRFIAESIREVIAHDLPVVRLGGDRFVFMSEDLDLEQAAEAFERLGVRVEEKAANHKIFRPFSFTTGIYFLRKEDLTSSSYNKALDYVSIAHRKAHDTQHACLVPFTDKDYELDKRRAVIEQSIDNALATGQIQVWYQPQIDYAHGEVIGAEALSRWHHPDLGWISPIEFIPALENCGRIHDLDLFVWEEACRSAARWRSFAEGKPVPISVNVSRMEMFEPGLIEHFLELQQKYDLPIGSLRLEVTESAFVEEAERLHAVIERLRSNHMLVEMDDFGSGLSSLNMLKDVPVDVVKLDMGFMQSSVAEDRGGVVLGSVIRMLQGLDTPIIAEGVETLEQAEMLKNMGCHLMQGYHFSRPMPLAEFESFLQSSSTVENSEQRERRESNLEQLTSIDPTSSFLFNEAMGPTMFFFAGAGTSESILANDEFYEACGISRDDFGHSKINPIEEIDPESRASMWRAAAEAREHGSAMCHAQVRLTRRWIDCVIRFLSRSPRGDVYSLNIVRSGSTSSERDSVLQRSQNESFGMEMLDKIVPSGFVKCEATGDLYIDFVSKNVLDGLGVDDTIVAQRFHGSFMQIVIPQDRGLLADAIRESRDQNDAVTCALRLHHGFGQDLTEVRLVLRACSDAAGREWLYMLVLLSGETYDSTEAGVLGEHLIPFDFDLAKDLLVIYDVAADGTKKELRFENWLEHLDSMPDFITHASATQVLASVRDLRQHPTTGFFDVKCNMRGGDELRWYHVDYTCEADIDGNTTVIHGYAQDSNDQMGSMRWWRRQAEIDQLTGLLNRNAAERGINLSTRMQGGGTMFMVDLDGFKRVNDELGHLAGDALLRDVAQALEGCFREGDVLGRYGGDEFVAYMSVYGPHARSLARRRAQQIIDAVAATRSEDGTKAACSVGIAISNDREATFYDLLEVADRALYQSKSAGRGTYTLLEI